MPLKPLLLDNIENLGFPPPNSPRPRVVSAAPTGDDPTRMELTFDRPVFSAAAPFNVPEITVAGDDTGMCESRPTIQSFLIAYSVTTASETWAITSQPDAFNTLIVIPQSGTVDNS